MKPILLKLAALVLILGFGVDATAQDAFVVGQEVGDIYPDFHLPRLDGTKGMLSDYRGKKVLLFHFASW
jgi:hypothetical protein